MWLQPLRHAVLDFQSWECAKSRTSPVGAKDKYLNSSCTVKRSAIRV